MRNRLKLLSACSLLSFGALLNPISVTAQIPQEIYYQAYLTDPTGQPMNSSSITVDIDFFNAEEGGTLLHEVQFPEIDMIGSEGYLSLYVPTRQGASQLDARELDGPIFLQVTLTNVAAGTDPEVLLPRQKFVPSVSALNSDFLDGLDSSSFMNVEGPQTISGSKTFLRPLSIKISSKEIPAGLEAPSLSIVSDSIKQPVLSVEGAEFSDASGSILKVQGAAVNPSAAESATAVDATMNAQNFTDATVTAARTKVSGAHNGPSIGVESIAKDSATSNVAVFASVSDEYSLLSEEQKNISVPIYAHAPNALGLLVDGSAKITGGLELYGDFQVANYAVEEPTDFTTKEYVDQSVETVSAEIQSATSAVETSLRESFIPKDQPLKLAGEQTIQGSMVLQKAEGNLMQEIRMGNSLDGNHTLQVMSGTASPSPNADTLQGISSHIISAGGSASAITGGSFKTELSDAASAGALQATAVSGDVIASDLAGSVPGQVLIGGHFSANAGAESNASQIGVIASASSPTKGPQIGTISLAAGSSKSNIGLVGTANSSQDQLDQTLAGVDADGIGVIAYNPAEKGTALYAKADGAHSRAIIAEGDVVVDGNLILNGQRLGAQPEKKKNPHLIRIESPEDLSTLQDQLDAHENNSVPLTISLSPGEHVLSTDLNFDQANVKLQGPDAGVAMLQMESAVIGGAFEHLTIKNLTILSSLEISTSKENSVIELESSILESELIISTPDNSQGVTTLALNNVELASNWSVVGGWQYDLVLDEVQGTMQNPTITMQEGFRNARIVNSSINMGNVYTDASIASPANLPGEYIIYWRK